jgi:hypothetical protein
LKAENEKDFPVTSSLVTLGLDLAAYAGCALYTLGSRRTYRGLFEDARVRSLSAVQDLFLNMPSMVWSAAYLLVIIALLVKEFAVENKRVTLRLNLLALLGAALLLAAYVFTVQLPAQQLPRR